MDLMVLGLELIHVIKGSFRALVNPNHVFVNVYAELVYI